MTILGFVIVLVWCVFVPWELWKLHRFDAQMAVYLEARGIALESADSARAL